jgi:hypothetical protein
LAIQEEAEAGAAVPGAVVNPQQMLLNPRRNAVRRDERHRVHHRINAAI